MDVTDGPDQLDFSNGTISPTGRDFDFAIEGPGFFVVETASGPRYTRNGHFDRSADGLLVTDDGRRSWAKDGPIEVGTGGLEMGADGTVRAGGELRASSRSWSSTTTSSSAREGLRASARRTA